ncbi:TonB-dependent receptor [Spongiivirga sp. MCCC 1A20706]|uniref:TonB-dependent receptor domain-containing protein n=1 Tax=Spongiivirga sp. MCCC 1A20706 TaxID=3160963 RepID=UPI003977BE06
MNSKRLYLLILLFAGLQLLYGQNQTTFKLQGMITSETNESLPYVNVLLLDAKETLIKATTTNEKGDFKIADINVGSYQIKISFIGYTTIIKQLDFTTSDINLGTIKLQPSVEALNEVTVVGEKPVIQVAPDKTIFNVSSVIGSAGVNGLELMRKAPGVRLENENNIVVEGKTGVLIYIDGRQSYLRGDDLTAYLQSLQADTIESIEIITQPSSRFDAEGNAGIINIVLKREKGIGTRGSVSSTVTVGDFARTNNSLSLTSRLKKWNLYGSYSNYFGRSTGFINLFRTQGDKIFDAQTDSEYDSFSNNIRIGGDYYASDKHTLGAVISLNLNNAESRSNSRTPIVDRSTNLIDSILRAPNSSSNDTQNFTANVNYRYKDTSGVSFSTDFDFGKYKRERFNNQPNFYVTPEGDPLNEVITEQDTPTDISIYAGRIDYGQNLGKGTIELGAKVSQVITDNQFDFFDVINRNSVLNVDRSNQFEYNEKIYAAYFKYNVAFKKLKLQFGLRSETTDSEGDLTTINNTANETIKLDYTDLFPSAGLTFQVNQKNSLALTYSRRIQRPNYQSLNPFEFQLDELSFRKGNPFLQPQYTDNIKISHTYKYTLTTSLSYSYVSDFFAQVTEVEGENRNFIITRNVADNEVYNMSISYPFKINSKWSAYANVYGTYNVFTATDPSFISNSQATFGFYAQNTFKLPKKFRIEISGWYSSPSIWGGTYETQSIGSLNIALQKSWKNWNFKLTGNDVLYTIPWRGVTQFPNLQIVGTGGSDSRNINFYVQYTFGNKEVKKIKERKGGIEDQKNRID